MNSVFSIASDSKTPIKSFKAGLKTQVIYHPLFGFNTPEGLASRAKMRTSSGLRLYKNDPLFSFDVDVNQDKLQITNLKNCTISSFDSGFKIKSTGGEFSLIPNSLDWMETPHVEQEEASKILPLLALLLCLLLGGVTAYYYQSLQTIEQPVAANEEPPPVLIEPMKQQKVEVRPEPPKEPQVVVKDPRVVAKKILNQNLGFLKLLGHKEIKNIKGGLKTQEQNASAGAGAGGTEGSGGELLAGVGQGLRKITVGNSGVAGLGGIGNKGRGGGLGGYGDTTYSGSGGGALSTVPLSQQASIPSGSGIDRSLILATILRYLNQIRACYEEGLKTKPNLIGQVTTDFEINPAGNLNYARIAKTSLNDAGVEGCITQKMMTWKFPIPKKGGKVPVSYPFMLRPMKQ